MTTRLRQRRYEMTRKGRETKRRYVLSGRGRRTQLLYNRLARYSRDTDRFIAEQEATFGTTPNDKD